MVLYVAATGAEEGAAAARGAAEPLSAGGSTVGGSPTCKNSKQRTGQVTADDRPYLALKLRLTVRQLALFLICTCVRIRPPQLKKFLFPHYPYIT